MMVIRFFSFLLLNSVCIDQTFLKKPIFHGQDVGQLVDCKYSSSTGAIYDLNNLINSKSWPLNLTTTQSTPPSTTIETTLISLCKNLPLNDPEQSCPDGTLVCMYVFNQINSDRRLERIIPISTDSSPKTIRVERTGQKESLQIAINGSTYNNIPQSTVFNLTCSDQKDSGLNPTTVYDSLQGTLKVTWSTPIACGSTDDNKSTSNPSSSLFRNFIFFIFIIFSLYLVIGIWYNYTTYGLRDLDALPHKEFWQELPGKLVDLIKSGGRIMTSRPTRSEYASI